MAEEKNYCIKVPGALVEVTEDVYLAYFRARRRWSAQNERDTYNGLISYDAMDTEEMLGEETIPDSAAIGVEDVALDRLMQEKLHRCLAELSMSEQDILHALYFEGLSERRFSQRIGIPQRTIHDRKRRALAKLKKMLET